MTKLFDWLSVFILLGAFWLFVVNNKVEIEIAKQHPTLVLWSPLIFVVLFGLYAVTVVLYRVFTFNNCEEAAEELQREIKEARADLAQLGFRFKTPIK